MCTSVTKEWVHVKEVENGRTVQVQRRYCHDQTVKIGLMVGV